MSLRGVQEGTAGSHPFIVCSAARINISSLFILSFLRSVCSCWLLLPTSLITCCGLQRFQCETGSGHVRAFLSFVLCSHQTSSFCLHPLQGHAGRAVSGLLYISSLYHPPSHPLIYTGKGTALPTFLHSHFTQPLMIQFWAGVTSWEMDISPFTFSSICAAGFASTGYSDAKAEKQANFTQMV